MLATNLGAWMNILRRKIIQSYFCGFFKKKKWKNSKRAKLDKKNIHVVFILFYLFDFTLIIQSTDTE